LWREGNSLLRICNKTFIIKDLLVASLTASNMGKKKIKNKRLQGNIRQKQKIKYLAYFYLLVVKLYGKDNDFNYTLVFR
jgi:hypothetical protein